MFFLKSSKFQHNIKISIKTARVSRQSVSYDYVLTKHDSQANLEKIFVSCLRTGDFFFQSETAGTLTNFFYLSSCMYVCSSMLDMILTPFSFLIVFYFYLR